MHPFFVLGMGPTRSRPNANFGGGGKKVNQRKKKKKKRKKISAPGRGPGFSLISMNSSPPKP